MGLITLTREYGSIRIMPNFIKIILNNLHYWLDFYTRGGSNFSGSTLDRWEPNFCLSWWVGVVRKFSFSNFRNSLLQLQIRRKNLMCKEHDKKEKQRFKTWRIMLWNWDLFIWNLVCCWIMIPYLIFLVNFWFRPS